MKKYKLLVCGGTFDLLHKGHKSFLKQILENSEKAIIGLTSDNFVDSIKSGNKQNFKVREKALNRFLNEVAGSNEYEIVEIKDIYGPLLDPKLNPDAIVVTAETKSGADRINLKRKNMGLLELQVLVLSLEKAEDGGVISSSRIRNGEINRKGKLYISPMWQNKTFILPEGLRTELSKPFGSVLNTIPSDIVPSETVCVGDIAVKKFNELKIGQLLSIVDFTVQRKKTFNNLSELGFSEGTPSINVNNEHGTISFELLSAVRKAFEKKTEQVILVEGEEDLAVIPVILCSPLGFRAFYGQPNQGLVEVRVTEEFKEKIFNLVNKFNLE